MDYYQQFFVTIALRDAHEGEWWRRASERLENDPDEGVLDATVPLDAAIAHSIAEDGVFGWGIHTALKAETVELHSEDHPNLTLLAEVVRLFLDAFAREDLVTIHWVGTADAPTDNSYLGGVYLVMRDKVVPLHTGDVERYARKSLEQGGTLAETFSWAGEKVRDGSAGV